MSSILVSRERELARLGALLDDRSVRWITVVGLGGVGKSALVRECLGTRTDAELVLCRLDDLGAGHLEATVARAVGVEETAEALLASLGRGGPRLLVLDGAEVMTDEEATVLSKWIERAPRLRLLLTSRRRIGAPEEHVVRLEPLPLPEAGASREEILRSPAVALLVDRMRRIDDALQPDTVDVEGLGALARALDGLPLGLELCAPTAVLLGPDATRARMAEVVTATMAGAAAESRHASVERVLETTWRELPDWVARGLAQTSVFAGGFTLAAVDAVVDTGREHGGLELLQQLVDRSLVQVHEAARPGTERRFRLHALVRRHARRQLAPTDAVWARHEEYFLGGLVDADEQRVPPGGSAHDQLVACASDVMAAAARVRSDESASPERLARLATAARMLFRLDVRVPDLDGLIDRVVDPKVMHALGPAEASAIAELAGVVRGWDQVEGAAEWLERARELADETGDAERRFDAQLVLAHQHLEDAERHAARAALQSMRDLLAHLPGAKWRGWVVAMGALIEREHADGAWLEAELVEAERLFAAGGAPRRSRAWVRARAADVALDDGRPEAGLAHARSAVELTEASGPLRIFARLIESLCLTSMGDLRAAEQAVERLAEEAEDDTARRSVWLARAALRLQERDWEGAAAAFRALLEMPVDSEEVLSEAIVHLGLAVASARAGEPGRARRSLGETRGLMEGRDPALPIDALCDRLDAVLEGREPEPPPALPLTAYPATTAFARLITAAMGKGSPPSLALGLDDAWLAVSGGERIALTRRPVLQRLVRALVDRHLGDEGAALTTDELFDQGWPGERIDVDSARNRVRVALTRLRRLGLDSVIERLPEGVRIRPGVAVERRSED